MAVDLFSIGRFTVHGYGLMIGLGFLIAVLLGSYTAKKRGLSADHFTSIALWVLVIGFLGGKLLFIIVEFKQFLTSPMSVIGSEGFVVYGGVITGILSIYVYCKVKKLEFLDYIDIFAMYVPVNQAFGRIGCFLAGCCYGRRTDSFIGVVFPQGCLAPAGVKLLPTQLFMAGGDFLIFLFIFIYNRKTRKSGITTGLYLLLYSVGRFIIEFLRNDARGEVGVLSTSQFISIWMCAAAAALLIFFSKRSEKNNADGEKIDNDAEQTK